MDTNQNRLAPIFDVFYLINSKVRRFYKMCYKIWFLSCRYTPHFAKCQNRLSLTESLFNGPKPVINPISATTQKSDTNIKRQL